jgi:DtxR family transcriptional regulator, Mn-dependent transcriptional regulator
MLKIRRLLARWKRARDLIERELEEDALKHIQNYATQERRPSLDSLAGALEITKGESARILEKLVAQELIEMHADEFLLTAKGNEVAVQIIRAHRLWERFLAEETGFAAHEWHSLADQYEHRISREQANDLSSTLGHPTHDPHGDPIPSAIGELRSHGGSTLAAMAVNVPLRIVHIEDEPADIYAQLLKVGLYPGMIVTITDISPKQVSICADGKDLSLPAVVAANISVIALSELPSLPVDQCRHLSDLSPGQKGRVLNISPAARGPERRRFLDLGIIPKTIIEAEFPSPMGNPTAYRIRGALIALRREQADLINVVTLKEKEG